MNNILILSAGLGSRLKPLTNQKPKALVKFYDKPLLDYQLEVFSKIKSINKIFIAVGYKKEKFKKYKKNKKIKLISIPNFDKKSMLYTLMKSMIKIGSKQNILITYGDVIFNKNIINKIIFNKSLISTIFLTNYLKLWKIRLKKNYLSDLESFKTDKNNFIKEIGFKTSNLNNIKGQYIGISKFNKQQIFNIIKFYEKKKKDFSLDKKDITFFFNLLIKQNFKIKGLPVKSGCLEFDTYKDWKIYHNKKLINKKLFDLNEFHPGN